MKAKLSPTRNISLLLGRWPLLLAWLLLLPTAHAQIDATRTLTLEPIYVEPLTTDLPVLTIDPIYLLPLEPDLPLEPALPPAEPATDPDAPVGTVTDSPNNTTAPTTDTVTGDGTATDGSVRPPADEPVSTTPETGTSGTDTGGTPSLFVPAETDTENSTIPTQPAGTFTPRQPLPADTRTPPAENTSPAPECPAVTPAENATGSSVSAPTPCPTATPVIPQIHPLLFIGPFAAVLLFWGILSFLNGSHGRLEQSLRQRHLQNRHLDTVDRSRRQTYGQLLDFLAASTDSGRPLNHQALEQLLSRVALLGSQETNEIGAKIRQTFENDDRSALKPLIRQLTAAIRRDLQG
jgi:hypothetical protein